MPDGKTPLTNFNPNEFKVVNNNKKAVTDFNPNEFKVVGQSEPKSYGGDDNTIAPTYTTPKDLEVDNAINFIDKQAIDSGRIALSDERKSVLKDVLKNPNSTKEQKEQAILTVQGYDKDTSGDVSNKFYMQQDSNGVYVPKLLGSGQRPPKGTAINSFHGTQYDANNDSWYTDLSKSLANGLVEAAGGVVDLAQAGQQLVTGEESSILNDARNSVDFFKFKKDEDLNKSIYNTEGINKWADLLDKDRFDLSPSALWGTFNGLTESLSEFGFGTMVGGSLIKGAKGAKYALQGVDKAVELGGAAQKGAIVFGSTIAQLGDVMEAGKEAGLKGRDLPAFALATATAMGTIDAMTGLEGKVMSSLFKKSKAQMLKNAIKTVERDAAGNITPQAFKELAKRTSIQYGEMARNAGKEIVKDAIGEGTQEAVQDFTQKAAENLWDKMTDDERGQFGTDAFDAKSFGSYLNSFSTGAISGFPMAIQQRAFKNKQEEQSIHVYDRVKQGEDGIKALRIDLDEALKANDISQSEYDQANFKIDAYQKYHDETKDVNLKPEDERKAFELSFQIQGIKTEIPTNENEISKLDPISRAKVESKQKQAKELQNELNEIILKGEIKAEPVVASKIEEKVAKEQEKEIKDTETKPTQKEPIAPKVKAVKVDLEEGEGTTEIKVGKDYVKEPKLPKQPDLKDETRTYDTIDNETFNHTKFPSRTKFQMVVDKLSKWQNKEMSGVIKKKSYKYYDKESKEWVPNSVLEVELEDGKRMRFASSKYYDSKTEEGFRSHTRNERLLGNEEGVPVGLKLIDINNPKGLLAEGEYTPGKKVLKIYNKRTGQFLSWAKETHRGKADSKRADGSLVTTAEEGDLLKTLEGQDYNEDIKGNEGDIARIITPKPKPIIPVTQRAEDATNKIVEEGEKNVEEEKSARLTNQVRKVETPSAVEEKPSEKESLVPKATMDFEVKEVIDYNSAENNKYKPNQQLKFNQGTFEPVRIVADEDLIELISIGSQINNDLKGNKKKTYSLDRKKELEAKFGISATFAHSKAKVLARENRSSSQEKIIILGDKTIVEDIKKGPIKEIKVEEKQAPKPIEEKKEIKPALIEISDSQKQSLLDNGYTEKEVNDAISEANRLVNLPVNELLKELNDKKMFVSTGNTNVWRVDTRGLTTKDVSNAIEHILKGTGENVKYVQTFINEVLNDIKKYGNVSGIIGAGGMTQKSNISLYEFLLEKELNPGITSEMPLTDEEIKNQLDSENERNSGRYQKISQRKGDINKVVDAIKKALPKIKVEFGDLGIKAGKVSADGKFIYINPNYAGLDTPIHEGGHILIDAMGYNNKIIQAAIKQLRNTPLYTETKERYKELSEQELDKEVLAEAIGREGADIFDKVEDRSKFKAYLDYIFDWLKQKFGMDKNIAKSLAKQIIGGIKTKNLEGTNTGKEQLQKADKEKKKNPIGLRPLSFPQYAAEHGFDYEKETDKINEAKALSDEALYERDLAKEDAENAITDKEAEVAEKILEEKQAEYDKAYSNYKKVSKRKSEYNKYRKDFNEIQSIIKEKELSDYSTEELQDLITKLHSFDNKAAKSVRNEAMLKFAMIATKKQQKIFEGKTGYIAELAKTKDISPLQRRILHHSHFSENNADMQAVSLAFGNAIMDKITDANTKKATHEKLGKKVIAEENKRLGIVGAAANRFSSDSAKYFDWMTDKDGNLMTIDEAKAKGLSEAKMNYLKFTRETIADYRGLLEENNFDNSVMEAIRIDKGFMEAYKSEGLLPAFSYYLGGGANNLGKVRIVHNGQIKSYSEIEKEILANADRKSIASMAKTLFDLLVANIKARYQLKKGFNVDEKENPLEIKGDAEYSLNEKGQLVSKFDKPRAKDRGYSKDFYKAMNQFIDESAHTKHISKIMPLVDSVEYLNKNGYTDEGYIIKPNVAKWIEDWKKLHIFKEPHVNDPILDASIKAMRKLVASTTMWFNIPANVLNVFMGNYSNWRQENGKTVALGNKRLFGGNGKNRAYGLDIIKKYNLVNQDYDSNATMKAGAILSNIGTWGTKVGEYQIQGSLGLGLLTEDEFNSFEYTKDKYGNEILTVKPDSKISEEDLKKKMIQVKNRITDIQGKYPDEDRRNIMKGEIGKAAFQFKVWIPDWFKERFSAKYINAYGVEKEGTLTKLLRVGIKEMYADLKKGDFKNIYKNNPSFMSNLKGVATIGTLMALAHQDDDDERKRKGALNFQNALSQVLFILDLEQDKYLLSNPVAALGKTKDLLSAFEALVNLDEETLSKLKRVIPANKLEKVYDSVKSVTE